MGKGGGSGSSKGEVRYDVVQEPGERAPPPAPAPAQQTSSVPNAPESPAPILSPSSSPAESPARPASASRSGPGPGHSHTASLQFPPVPSELPIPVLFPSAPAAQAQAASVASASSSPASSDGPPALAPAPAILQNTTSFPSLRDWGDARIPNSGPLSSPSVRLLDNPVDAPSAAALLPPLPQSGPGSPWAPVRQGPPPSLPPGWAFQIDPASGFPFFYNASLRLSQWEDPRGRGWGLPDPSSQQGEEAAQAPSGSPLDWPLPPGWQQIEDPTSGRLYFVNYAAHLLLDTDPRVLIAASAGPAGAVPVAYPPPWTDVPVQVPVAVQQQGEASGAGEPSWRPSPPAPVAGRQPSLWWKLGHGYGGSRSQVRAAGSRTNFLLLNPHGRAGEGEWGREEGKEEEKKKKKKKKKFKFKVKHGDGSSSSSSGNGSGDERSGDGPIWGLTGPLLADEVAQELGELLGQSVGGSDSNDGSSSSGAGGGSDDDGHGSGSDHNGDGGDGGDGLNITGLETILAYAGAGPRDLPGGGRGGGGAGGVGGVGSGGCGRERCMGPGGWDGTGYGAQRKRRREKRVASGFGRGWPWAVYSALLGMLASLLLWVLRVVSSRCRSEGTRSFRVSRVWKSAGWKGRRTGFKCKSSLTRMGRAVSSLCIKLQTGYYQHLFEHQPVKLRVLTALDGASPLCSQLPHRRREITIVTQASADRLQAIEAMASSWQGALCVAIHVRTRGELQQVYPTLCNLHARVEGTGLCRLHICIAMEVGLPDDASAMAALYPVNSMRNIALRMATTELVFLLDADFVPCPGLHDRLTNKSCYSKMLRDAKQNNKMFVVAAFESRTSHRPWKQSHSPCQIPRTFEELREMWHQGLVQGFHCGHFPRGHQPTDYSRFFTHASSKPYRVQFREYYEPYVICARKSVPFFDERFRGYGLNKISHAYHCASTGMTFSVLPRQYVWEFPHPRSEAWIRTFGTTKDPYQVLRVQGLYTRFKDELLAGHPSSSTILNPVTTEILSTTVRCLIHLFFTTQQGLEKFVVPSPWSLTCRR